MKSLKKQYGTKKGTDIYYAMENEGNKSFKKGMKTIEKRSKKRKK